MVKSVVWQVICNGHINHFFLMLDNSNRKDMDLRIDEEKNIAYIKLSGLLIKEVILRAFDSTVSDRKYKKKMGRLWDFSNMGRSCRKCLTFNIQYENYSVGLVQTLILN